MTGTSLAQRWKPVQHQFAAVLCANIVSLSHGCILGWLSPVLPLLKSPDSPLRSGPISVSEASWIGAIICLGGVFGNFAYGTLVNYIGSKRSISWLAFPQLGFWLFVKYGTSVYHLYAARIFAGITGGGVFVCIPLFVSEISDDRIRGTLGSLLLVNYNIGILVSYCIGAYTPYHIVPYILVALPLLFVLTFMHFPHTPQFLLRAERTSEAEHSLRFYRNCPKPQAANGAGLKAPEQRQFDEEFDRLQRIAQKTRLNGAEEALRWSDLCTPDARRGLLIGVTLCALNQFSGCFALINYAATIFHDSGSRIDHNLSAIVLACGQIAGTYLSTCLVDRIGRRVLLITSAMCTALGLFATGAYTFAGSVLGWPIAPYGWMPVVSLTFVVFIASLGILPLPFVVLAEVLPGRIRAIGSTLCVTSISLVSFVILKTFPLAVDAIGLHGCMWTFSGICVLGSVFVWACVDETRGKRLDEAEARTRALSLY